MGRVRTGDQVKADTDQFEEPEINLKSAEDVGCFLGVSQPAAPLRGSLAAKDYIFREEDKKV